MSVHQKLVRVISFTGANPYPYSNGHWIETMSLWIYIYIQVSNLFVNNTEEGVKSDLYGVKG